MNLNKLEKLLNKKLFEEAHSYIQSNKALISEADYRLYLALLSYSKNDLDQAEPLLRQSLKLNPKNPITLSTLGYILVKKGLYKLAKPLLGASLESGLGKNKLALLNYAKCLSEEDRNDEALTVLLSQSAIHAKDLNYQLSIAAMYRAVLKHEKAMSVLTKLLDLYPQNENVQRAMADCLAEQDPHEASKIFNRLSETFYEKPSFRWNWSFAELRNRNFTKGWELYEAGLLPQIGKVGRPIPKQVQTILRLENLHLADRKKATFFACEQGLGDQILFLSTIAEATRELTNSVLVGEKRMVPILRRSFPRLSVIQFGSVPLFRNWEQDINGYYPIGSLMKIYRPTAADFKKTKFPYLLPDETLLTKFKDTIKKKHPKRKIVGINWRGGHWARQISTKSLDFVDFISLFHGLENEISLVSLQYGDTSEEEKLCKKNGFHVDFVKGIDFKKDIDPWFALGASCDMVVSVSSAIVHFLGASEKKVLLLSTEFQGPFIWGNFEGPTLPYPSVTNIKQRKNELTEYFLRRVRAELEKYL